MYHLIISLLISLSVSACKRTAVSELPEHAIHAPSGDSIIKAQLQEKAIAALQYCADNGFSTAECFLLHMGQHSGYARFYIWDLQKNCAIDSALVSHGCGMSSWGTDGTAAAPVFSNTYDSHCSSLGKYRIGERGWSQWGINVKYQLHGLDSTNSNAYGRQVVLHSWNMMPDVSTYPAGAPEGWGCPAVSDAFMQKLDTRLKTSGKPVLLWMFTD